MSKDQPEPIEQQLRYQGVLLENMQGQLVRFAEAMGNVPAQVQQLTEDVTDLKSDMKVVKAAVTDTSREQKRHGVKLGNHERRIRHLEQAA